MASSLIRRIKKKDMNKETKPIRLARPILWQDKSGKYVVIEGPFPYGFVRSADAPTVHKASMRQPYTELGELIARPETTADRRYAKTLKEYVSPVEDQWGPISY